MYAQVPINEYPRLFGDQKASYKSLRCSPPRNSLYCINEKNVTESHRRVHQSSSVSESSTVIIDDSVDNRPLHDFPIDEETFQSSDVFTCAHDSNRSMCQKQQLDQDMDMERDLEQDMHDEKENDVTSKSHHLPTLNHHQSSFHSCASKLSSGVSYCPTLSSCSEDTESLSSRASIPNFTVSSRTSEHYTTPDMRQQCTSHPHHDAITRAYSQGHFEAHPRMDYQSRFKQQHRQHDQQQQHHYHPYHHTHAHTRTKYHDPEHIDTEFNNDVTMNNNKIHSQPSSYSSKNDGIVPSNIELFLQEYEVIKKIGSGSAGEVFHVGSKRNHPSLNSSCINDNNNERHPAQCTASSPFFMRDFAVKVIEKSRNITEKGLSIISREIAIHRSAIHPNIAELYTTFGTTKSVILVQHYYPSGDLASRLERDIMFKPKQTARYCLHLTNALDYLHRNGIIFRDLKPENILISPEDEFVLTDFGLSRTLQHPHEFAKTFCGTPEYLAPEIILGQQYCFAIDWWALGVVICELATGVIPFTADVLSENYDNIVHCRMFATKRDKIRFLQLPPNLKSTIVGLLTRDVSARFKATHVRHYMGALCNS